MPSTRQDKEFAEEMEGSLDRIVMSSSSLDNAINWMQSKLTPDDVFTDKQLDDWATLNGYVKE